MVTQRERNITLDLKTYRKAHDTLIILATLNSYLLSQKKIDFGCSSPVQAEQADLTSLKFTPTARDSVELDIM